VVRMRIDKKFKVELVKGHPTEYNFEQGHRKGKPVSIHNVWCDEECSRLARKYVEEVLNV
jgi:hypothetical protein